MDMAECPPAHTLDSSKDGGKVMDKKHIDEILDGMTRGLKSHEKGKDFETTCIKMLYAQSLFLADIALKMESISICIDRIDRATLANLQMSQ